MTIEKREVKIGQKVRVVAFGPHNCEIVAIAGEPYQQDGHWWYPVRGVEATFDIWDFETADINCSVCLAPCADYTNEGECIHVDCYNAMGGDLDWDYYDDREKDDDDDDEDDSFANPSE